MVKHAEYARDGLLFLHANSSLQGTPFSYRDVLYIPRHCLTQIPKQRGIPRKFLSHVVTRVGNC